MPPTLEALGIDRLSAEDRLTLAEAIWESVAREMEQAPLPEASGRSWSDGWPTASPAPTP